MNDTLEDLMDLTGVTERQAERILAWHNSRLHEEQSSWGGMAIVRLMNWLHAGCINADLRLRLTATAFGLGLGHLTDYANQEEAANALGVTPMAISDMANRAKAEIVQRL